VSAAGLSRATMSAPVTRNDAETLAEEKKHLRVPIIRRERPAVTEHNRLSAAPVFIIDVDVRSVFFSNGHVWHKRFPFGLSCTKQSATLDRPNPTKSSVCYTRCQRYGRVTRKAWAGRGCVDRSEPLREAYPPSSGGREPERLLPRLLALTLVLRGEALGKVS
jgi:hypothetical protein